MHDVLIALIGTLVPLATVLAAALRPFHPSPVDQPEASGALPVAVLPLPPAAV